MRRSARIVSIFSVVASFLSLALFVLPVAGQTLSQGYDSDSALQKGMIVQLKENDGTKVQPVNSDAIDKMYGVVVDSNDAAATLSKGVTKVFVATTGRYSVLMSDQNGAIKIGDQVTASSINGIGMKADDYKAVVLGRAIEAFDGKNQVLSTTKLTAANGITKEVHIGRIMVDVSVAKNPRLIDPTRGIPDFLRRAGEAVAGKPVQPVRIYLACGIVILGFMLAATISYGAVTSGMVAIGRNPFNRKSIAGNLIRILLLGIAVFVCGIAGAYVLLRL